MLRTSLRLCIVLASIVVGANIAAAEFDGAPSSPQNFTNHGEFANYDVQISSRAINTWGDNSLDPIQAEHGADCSGPPSTHPNTSYAGSVYVCNNHLMTALNASDYGAIYVTPNKVLDCSSGSCSVTWEMSTKHHSIRDWPDVHITPWEDNLALPLVSSLAAAVDFQGAPRNAIHVGFDSSEGAPLLTTVLNNQWRSYNEGWATASANDGITAGTNESAVRQTFRITLTSGRVKFERLASSTATALVFFDKSTVQFPMTNSMVVTWGHHSYTPTKDNAGIPGTRHWDNFTLSPSRPITIIHATQRSTSGGTVQFTAPAPANAFLRFSAIGKVSVNGQPVSPRIPTVYSEHFNSYMVPIPQGARSVTFSFGSDGWFPGPYMAKDMAFWSQGGTTTQSTPATSTPNNAPAPTATSTPVPGATATQTPIPNGSTPVAQTATPRPNFWWRRTPTPKPAATATKTATPKPGATATKTATPRPAATATKTATPKPWATATKTATPRPAIPTATSTPVKGEKGDSWSWSPW